MKDAEYTNEELALIAKCPFKPGDKVRVKFSDRGGTVKRVTVSRMTKGSVFVVVDFPEVYPYYAFSAGVKPENLELIEP